MTWAELPPLRGDRLAVFTLIGLTSELPPLARGPPRHPAPGLPSHRTTPAGAGTARGSYGRRAGPSNYPRWRGDRSGRGRNLPTPAELPPLARGPQRTGEKSPDACRTTPAGAGTASDGTRSQDHSPELPPLARGPLGVEADDAAVGRTTPAGAGTAICAEVVKRVGKNYPRWRGDRLGRAALARPRTELPPLARGPLHRTRLPRRQGRTTPAGAGTARAGAPAGWRRRNYPRWRGDRASLKVVKPLSVELPPLARGPRSAERTPGMTTGTTPAGAGTAVTVVPAVCRVNELPPLARGPRPPARSHLRGWRTTPAGAGTAGSR